MMKNGATVLFLSLLIASCMCARDLILSTLIFRHGERERYNPKQPAVKCLKHLINQGMRQQYINGRYHHWKYIDHRMLLPENYDMGSIYFRSTYLSRAMNSALSFYTGLYSGQVFEPSRSPNVALPIFRHHTTTRLGLWTPRPAPIHTLLKQDDRLMYSYKPAVCPALRALKKQQWNSDKAKDLEESKTGRFDWQQTQPHVPQPKVYAQLANNRDLIKLASHNLLLQIVDYMRLALLKLNPHLKVGKTQEELLREIRRRDPAYRAHEQWRLHNPMAEELRLLVFSSHDTMVVSLVNALGVRLDTRVGVASTISLELLLDDRTSKPYVEVQLNRKRLAVPGCEGLCTLKQFISAVKEYGAFSSDQEYLAKCNDLKLLA
jgi:hypothetical protein